MHLFIYKNLIYDRTDEERMGKELEEDIVSPRRKNINQFLHLAIAININFKRIKGLHIKGKS